MKPNFLKPYTHYFIPDDGRTLHVFYLDECEKCGAQCEGPNAIGVVITPRELDDMGLICVEERYGEMGYCEKFDGAVCYDCGEWDA